MTLLQKMSIAATLGSATFSVAASIPKTILPDNVVRCEPDDSCLTETINGHSYKILNTPRFTVMISVSRQGIYTRADVSITNHTDTPLNMSPEDFRVEVLTPKPKVLLYVPPANVVLPPPPAPPAAPASNPAPQLPPMAGNAFVHQTPTPPAVDTATDPAAATSEVDADSIAAREKASQEEAEKAAEQHDLSATLIGPNEITSGRVYFERDKHAHLVNVVLPIAGLVFEFPYAMKK
jgi:hypothetical protein